MKFALLALVITISAFCLDGCTACTSRPSNPDEVRARTAQATAEVKNDAKAVAQGVRDGLRSSGTDKPLDLNTASKGQLTSLPGITDDAADRIVEGRPYSDMHQLIERKIISRAQYDQIADRITVTK